MAKAHSLAPLFYNRAGIPFVFWDQDKDQLLILHGSYVTVFCYATSVDYPGDPSLYATSKQELMIYGNRSRIVASLIPSKNALVIRHDMDYLVFSHDCRIRSYKTMRVQKMPTLFSRMLPAEEPPLQHLRGIH